MKGMFRTGVVAGWMAVAGWVLTVPVGVLAQDAAGGGLSERMNRLSRRLEELESSLSGLQERVELQARTITALERENGELRRAAERPPQEGGTLLSTPATAPARSVSANAFNPEIGLVADFLGQATESDEDEEGNDRFSMRHIELILGSEVDPYSRFDAVLTLSDFEDPDVEEAFLTHHGLPGEIQGRFGRFRPRFGRSSSLHTDQLDTVYHPEVIRRYLGAEGLFRSGIELSRYLPVPWEEVTHEVIVGFLEGGVGEEGELLGETRRAPTGYARIRNFWEISDHADLDLGGSFLMGSSDEDSAAEVRAFGADLTANYRFDGIRRLRFQAETIIQDRSVSSFEEEEAIARTHPGGFYTLLDLKYAPNWSVGAQYDYVQPTFVSEEAQQRYEWGVLGYLTFHQSEFARWRFSYQYLDQESGEGDNRFFVQGTFAIGTHKHKLL